MTNDDEYNTCNHTLSMVTEIDSIVASAAASLSLNIDYLTQF